MALDEKHLRQEKSFFVLFDDPDEGQKLKSATGPHIQLKYYCSMIRFCCAAESPGLRIMFSSCEKTCLLGTELNKYPIIAILIKVFFSVKMKTDSKWSVTPIVNHITILNPADHHFSQFILTLLRLIEYCGKLPSD